MHGQPHARSRPHAVAPRPRDLRTYASRGLRPPIGQFSGHTPAPQDPGRSVIGEMQDSLMDQPGLRLAGATGRRVFFSGALEPQRFTRAPSAVNADYSIQTARIQMNTRRSIGRSRGRIEDALDEERLRG